jgi:hypothetical protein
MYIPVGVVGRVSERVAGHCVRCECGCFTGVCKWYVSCGLWQAGLEGTFPPGFVQVLAVIFGTGFV